jgi:VanZ family protein
MTRYLLVRPIMNSRNRVGLWLLVVVWMAVIFALSSQSQLPTPAGLSDDVRSVIGHLCVYGVLAGLLWMALPRGWPASRRIAVAFAGAMLFGVTDEWHQSFVPNRESTVSDLIVDAIGASMALIALQLASQFGSPDRS